MELPLERHKAQTSSSTDANPIDVAVIWVDKARKGRVGWVQRCSQTQLRAYRLRKQLKPVMDFAKYAMLGLAVFETPSWCLFNDEECFGARKESLFASGAPLLPLSVSNSVNMVCLIVFLAYLALRRVSLGEADEMRLWTWHSFGLACVLLAFLDSFVAIFNTGGIIPGTFKLTRLLRPLIFLAFTTHLREAAERVARSVPWFLDVLLALALCLFFFVWIGIVVFAETAGGKVHFPSWAESFSNMWILFTTANNPDAWVNIYIQHRLAFFYFFAYIVITVYLLNNLMLSSIYDAYKDQLVTMVRQYDENMQRSLEHAFELLQDGTGKIAPDTWVTFCLRYFKAHGDPKEERWNRHRAMEVFKILDIDNTSTLSMDEFNVVLRVLSDDKEYIPATRPPSWGVIKRLGNILTQSVTVGGFTISEESVIDMIVGIGILLAFVQTVLFFNSGEFQPAWLDESNSLSVALFCLTCFYVVEVTLRLVVLGPERFWYCNPFMNRYDLLNVYGLVIAEVVSFSLGSSYIGQHLVVLLHIARSLRLFRHVKQLRFVAELSVTLAPTYWRMGMLLVLVFYIFATIGVQLFGGLIYKGNPALKGSGYEAANYWAFNFNDFNSGMVTLFLLMVVNNWFVFTGAFMAVTGKWAASFSISFFVITNLIVLNVLMSLILDCSGTVREEIQAVERGDLQTDETHDYMHMIRHALLHHEDDDLSSCGSPKKGRSTSTLASSPSYSAPSYGATMASQQ